MNSAAAFGIRANLGQVLHQLLQVLLVAERDIVAAQFRHQAISIVIGSIFGDLGRCGSNVTACRCYSETLDLWHCIAWQAVHHFLRLLFVVP